MDHDELVRRFAALTTPHVADGCVRASVPVRCGPAGLRPVSEGDTLVGRVLPARHAGSVDVFLEAFESAAPGEVLVADNNGRTDEACVGDLVVAEAQAAGVSGVLIWGLHRDTADVRAIGLPVFSLGALPTGPLRLDPRADDALEAATVGEWTVGRDDLVFADEDGALFVPADRAADVLGFAETIRDTERRQAERIRGGQATLREQVRFAEFLERRKTIPDLTLRQHLLDVGGAVEV